MDEEGMQIDIAEAIGKASAAICLQGAIISTLMLKGVLTESEIATMSGVASQTLAAMEGLSDPARELGQSCLRGFAKMWTTHVTKN